MDASGSGEGGGRGPQRWLRDLAAWSLGVVGSIAVNLVSGNLTIALHVALAMLGFGGALGATYLIRRRLDATSTLAQDLPLLLLAAASPFILMSVVGTWGGYLMFIAAVLVAIAVASDRKVAALSRRERLWVASVTVGSMSWIAVGPVTVATGLHDPTVGVSVRIYIIVGGIAEIVCGSAMLKHGRVLLPHFNEHLARQVLLLGIVFAAFGASEAHSAIHSQDVATLVLPFVGLVIGTTSCSLVVLVTPERIDRVRALVHELTRPRGPAEVAPSPRHPVMRFLERIGPVNPSSPQPRAVDPDRDHPEPS